MERLNLPQIPEVKQPKDQMTPEQEVLYNKIIPQKPLEKQDQECLQEAIAFYKDLMPKLQAIPLSELNDAEATQLWAYLGNVFNVHFPFMNDLDFPELNRVTIVKNGFLEKGKVRNPKYLSYPPKAVNQENGIYKRANSPDKTVFYASALENVALRETKPEEGERIIISTWQNTSGKPFNSYPISNTDIDNPHIVRATKALKHTLDNTHPLLAEIMDVVISFLASEFVKELDVKNEKGFEYLYSAFFGDIILKPFNKDDPTPDIDCIIYPSVAWQHQHENVAVAPETVNQKLKLVRASEYRVLKTFYEQDLKLDAMPAELETLRESEWIEDDLIIWKDD